MLQSRWVGWLRQKSNCLEISMGYKVDYCDGTLQVWRILHEFR